MIGFVFVKKDPAPTPPHKGEGLHWRTASFLQHRFHVWQRFEEKEGERNGLAPPPCGEGLGRGLLAKHGGLSQ
jgi:hypothetical protein